MRATNNRPSEDTLNFVCPQRLGEILQQAHLVSSAQIAVATHDQQYADIRLGEILVLRGWLKQETADFFADQWIEALFQPQKQRLGDYLQAAALVDEGQVNDVCREQWHTGLRFGATAVLLGLIKPSTLDFFLTYLFPTEKQAGSLIQKRAVEISADASKTDQTPSDDVQWIG